MNSPVSFSQLHPETQKYLLKVMDPPPALVLGGLDPEKYPEMVASCGCKSIDGTVTDLCERHTLDYDKSLMGV